MIRTEESKGYEQRDFIDTGCKYSASCLSCTLPVCVEDVPWSEQLKIQGAKDDAERANAVLVAMETMPRPEAVKQIARDYSVTVRTIHAILARTGG